MLNEKQFQENIMPIKNIVYPKLDYANKTLKLNTSAGIDNIPIAILRRE